MSSFFSRVFRLRPGETGFVLALGFILLVNSLALEVSDVVAVSGFLDEVDTPGILLVYIVDFALLIFTTGLQSLIIDRFKRVSLIRWMIFGAALAYTVLRLLFAVGVPIWINSVLLFLLSDQQWLFFPLVFWVLANDLFSDMTQAKRIFPVIAAWGFIGQILGLGMAAAAPPFMARLDTSSVELLTLNVFLYLIAYLVLAVGLRKATFRQTAQKIETVQETLSEGWGFVKEVPSFRYLMLGVVATAAAIIMIEYSFLRFSDLYYTNNADAGNFQTFYSLTRLAVTAVAFLIQSFVTSRLIDKINLKNAFFILPATMAAVVVWIIALPGVISATIGFMLTRLSKQTVDESTRKSLLSLVPEERRGRVSIFIDSYLFSGGIILGCLIAGGAYLLGPLVGLDINTASDVYLYMPVALALIVLAVWSLFQMRGVYESSMLNWRLKRRQRGSSVLDKLEF